MQNRQCLPSLLSKSLLAGLILLCFAAAPDAPIAQDRGQGTKPKSEQRIALVIGNADYKEAKLPNPINDARDMAAALRGVGFEVLPGEDRNSRQMKELIRQFGQNLRAGGVGVFYFAGHGVQVAGRNYLIPVGAEINSEAEVEYETVELGFVLAQLEEARNRLNVVILDACRNNPYARSFRSGSRGLAGVRNAPSGTLIAYATAADDIASDGGSARNGLYTGELLAQIKSPARRCHKFSSALAPASAANLKAGRFRMNTPLLKAMKISTSSRLPRRQQPSAPNNKPGNAHGKSARWNPCAAF